MTKQNLEQTAENILINSVMTDKKAKELSGKFNGGGGTTSINIIRFESGRFSRWALIKKFIKVLWTATGDGPYFSIILKDKNGYSHKFTAKWDESKSKGKS